MSRKTIFVLGAGASKEVGLPIGNELTSEISNLLNFETDYSNSITKGDRLIYNALKAHSEAVGGSGYFKDLVGAAKHISEAMPQAESIDNFIHAHRGDNRIEVCGKLSIVRSILMAERNSVLYFDQIDGFMGLDHRKLQNVWYSKFFKILTNNCTANELEERLGKISLVIFNYDRCFEHYLYNALQNFYRITETEAAKLVNGIEIFHPYGVVGKLQWQGTGKVVGFGEMPKFNKLLELATEIKTFTEGTQSLLQDLLIIKRNMLLSEKIIFLGFAFHKLNLDVLRKNKEDKAEHRLKKFFATAKGFSNYNTEIIISDIKNLFPADTHLVNINNKLTCSQLFDEYHRSLTF